MIRQIPIVKENDQIYGWLQLYSKLDKEKGVRWIDKKDVSYSRIGKELGLCRQTVSRKLKKLLNESDLVVLNEERYELPILTQYNLRSVKVDILRKLISVNHMLNIYLYLFSRWQEEQKPFVFTIEQIKKAIGLSINSCGNNYIVSDIIFKLKELGLIDYKWKTMKITSVKTMYQIIDVKI